ncbi:MAG: 4a-hydroxytetrahydrobiopterin dehydratase [bacterium]|nr:4a-hydroxytetrahydrobiopterin dehydratase [bacterium]
MKPERVQWLLTETGWVLVADGRDLSEESQSILREYTCKNGGAAMKLTATLCNIAERHAHYPEIHVEGNVVHVQLTTPNEGLTEMDFDMALLFNNAYDAS